jgi:hypothetical protein
MQVERTTKLAYKTNYEEILTIAGCREDGTHGILAKHALLFLILQGRVCIDSKLSKPHNDKLVLFILRRRRLLRWQVAEVLRNKRILLESNPSIWSVAVSIRTQHQG